MGSKNYLKVAISPRTTLSEKKQKSCESYDSTCSNYSQFSENSDNCMTSPVTDDRSKPQSAFSNSESFSHFDFSSNDAQSKRTIWQRAVAPFRSFKEKRADLKRHKSVASPSRSPLVDEIQEIDPVYHLLKCAAAQKKFEKVIDGDKSVTSNENVLERSKSIPCNIRIHLDGCKGSCSNPACPCDQTGKSPVMKIEDLGQQAKREQSSRKPNVTSPHQLSVHSRSRSITTSPKNH